jgi:hypothetical protein
MSRNSVLLPAVLLATFAVYVMGLPGAFLLDDIPNLKVLERIAGNHWLAEFSSVIFTVQSGATRFLPMLTFGLQASAWPDHPAQFKLVNILLHLATGALIFLVVRRLCLLQRQGRPDAIALLAAAIWLFNPLQVSCVLYVVQRMNLMCALFTLAGILAYLRGRSMLAASPRSAFAWMSAGVVLGTGLAMLCKENGALLPLFVLAMELTLLARQPAEPAFRRWRAVFLYLPVVLLLALFAAKFSWLQANYAYRDFDMGERLVTQARILAEYISNFALPKAQGLGLFHDDYPVSRRPWSGADAGTIALHAALLGAALRFRKQWPVFSFGVLWFYVGHLLESTVIPLELYFEHRNYLPLLGPAYAIAAGFWHLYDKVGSSRLRGWVALGGAVWLLAAVGVTVAETRLWGNPLLQAAVWAKEHPVSVRSQAYYAQMLAVHDQPEAATRAFRHLVLDMEHPDQYAFWMAHACYDARLGSPDVDEVRRAFRMARHTLAPTAGLEAVVAAKESGGCERYAYEELAGLFHALLENPNYTGRRNSLYILLGRLQIATGNTDAALQSFDQSLALHSDVEVALLQVKALYLARRYAEAGPYLNKAAEINRANVLSRPGYARDIEAWKATVERAMSPRQ